MGRLLQSLLWFPSHLVLFCPHCFNDSGLVSKHILLSGNTSATPLILFHLVLQNGRYIRMIQKYKGDEHFSFIPSLLKWLYPLLFPRPPARQHDGGGARGCGGTLAWFISSSCTPVRPTPGAPYLVGGTAGPREPRPHLRPSPLSIWRYLMNHSCRGSPSAPPTSTPSRRDTGLRPVSVSLSYSRII